MRFDNNDFEKLELYKSKNKNKISNYNKTKIHILQSKFLKQFNSYPKGFSFALLSYAPLFFEKILREDYAHFRTIISPATEEQINYERKKVHTQLPGIEFDLNTPVVNIRTTLSLIDDIKFDLKRKFIDFAKDCDVIKLLESDAKKLCKTPFEAIAKSTRVLPVAMALMRLPIFAKDSQYFDCQNLNEEMYSPAELLFLRKIVSEEVIKFGSEVLGSVSEEFKRDIDKAMKDVDKIIDSKLNDRLNSKVIKHTNHELIAK